MDAILILGWCRIEGEDNEEYLLQDILLRRYSIVVDGHHTAPANVIERAVDLHALRITGSSGYQKCVNYLWRGWLVQDENDPSTFVEYKKKGMFISICLLIWDIQRYGPLKTPY